MKLIERSKIIIDSTADISKEILQEYNIDIARFNLTDKTANKHYKDGDLTNEELFYFLKQNHKFKTAQPAPLDYEELIINAKKDFEFIFILTMSSDMSGAYQSAMIAKEEMGNDNIFVIDSRQATIGTGLVGLHMIDHLKDTEVIEDGLNKISSTIDNTEMRVILDTPKYAVEGGRLSSAIGTLGDVIQIRPVVNMENGIPVAKKKMRLSTIKLAINEFKNILEAENINTNRIILGATSDMDDLDKIIANIPNMQYVEHLEKFKAGNVITSHSGPKTLGLAYTRKY